MYGFFFFFVVLSNYNMETYINKITIHSFSRFFCHINGKLNNNLNNNKQLLAISNVLMQNTIKQMFTFIFHLYILVLSVYKCKERAS